MRFMIFVIDSVSNSGTGSEIAAIDEFNQTLKNDGHFVMAAGLASSAKATLVDNRDKHPLVEAKSLNGEKFYSGFWIVDVPNAEKAESLALLASRACNRKLEIRPFL